MRAWPRGAVPSPRVAPVLGALLVALLAIPSALAQSDSVTLITDIEADARDQCPTALAVEGRLGAYLEGADAIVPLEARIHVASREGGFEATVVLRRGEGTSERRVEGATCAATLEATILVIAIAADRGVLDRTPPEGLLEVGVAAEPPSPVEDGDTPEPTVPETTAAETPGTEGTRAETPAREEPATARMEPVEGAYEDPRELASGFAPRAEPEPARSIASFVARAGPVLGVGMIPQPAPGLGAEVGIRLDMVEVTLGAIWLSDTVQALDERLSGVIGLAEGTLRVALVLELGPIDLLPALRLGVGAISGRSQGATDDRRGASPWVEGAAGLGARVRLGISADVDLALGVEAELVVPATRPSFVILGAGTVFTPSEVGGIFGLMVALSAG